ncbi:MAG: Uma2 family endonuclease, partial [Candidatus Eremiobacterota bacterium]
MTLVVPPHTDEQRFLTATDWSGYLHVLQAFQGVHIRITYDRGRLELWTTSARHEETRTLLGQLVETAFFEFDVTCKGAGSTTFRRQVLDRGLEPDECYYVGSLLQFELGQDLETVPIPDLVLEVEVTRSALNRGPGGEGGLTLPGGPSPSWRPAATGRWSAPLSSLTSSPGSFPVSWR